MRCKTRQEIEMEFTRAIDQATELERLAVDLSRIANRGVEPSLLVIRSSWEGGASESISYEGKKAMTDLYRTADNLLRVSRNIRATADIVYRAEKSAMKLCF